MIASTLEWTDPNQEQKIAPTIRVENHSNATLIISVLLAAMSILFVCIGYYCSVMHYMVIFAGMMLFGAVSFLSKWVHCNRHRSKAVWCLERIRCSISNEGDPGRWPK